MATYKKKLKSDLGLYGKGQHKFFLLVILLLQKLKNNKKIPKIMTGLFSHLFHKDYGPRVCPINQNL